VADPAPSLSFQDIRGEKAATDDYKDWTIVYTFADRKSNDPLMDWMIPAGAEVQRKHPDMRIAYLNFADVKSIPRFVHPMVRPILRRIDERSDQQAHGALKAAGVRDSRDRFAFHLTPDWDGRYLETFGIADARTYRVWIVVNGRVFAAMDQSQPNVVDRFKQAFDRIAGQKVRPEEEGRSESLQP